MTRCSYASNHLLSETRGVLYLTRSPFTIGIESGHRLGLRRKENGIHALQRVPPIRWLVLLPMAEELMQLLCDGEVKEVNRVFRLSAYS